ncbi:Zinc finger, RING-type [Dillenia turbinata]|uniref:RING-type E3 ubiquitin transferase n=1 Tax=Dillenia turbinata TaxID=194707 RepID=A0AAN8ZDT6_9MAGN
MRRDDVFLESALVAVTQVMARGSRSNGTVSLKDGLEISCIRMIEEEYDDDDDDDDEDNINGSEVGWPCEPVDEPERSMETAAEVVEAIAVADIGSGWLCAPSYVNINAMPFTLSCVHNKLEILQSPPVQSPPECPTIVRLIFSYKEKHSLFILSDNQTSQFYGNIDEEVLDDPIALHIEAFNLENNPELVQSSIHYLLRQLLQSQRHMLDVTEIADQVVNKACEIVKGLWNVGSLLQLSVAIVTELHYGCSETEYVEYMSLRESGRRNYGMVPSKESSIQALETAVFDLEEGQNCTICFEDFQIGKKCSLLDLEFYRSPLSLPLPSRFPTTIQVKFSYKQRCKLFTVSESQTHQFILEFDEELYPPIFSDIAALSFKNHADCLRSSICRELEPFNLTGGFSYLVAEQVIAKGYEMISDLPDVGSQYLALSVLIIEDSHYTCNEREYAEYLSLREQERHNCGMVPARESTIEALDTAIFNLEEGGSCTVCLKDFQDGDKVKVMPCLHYYHCECIENWLKISHYCPICRYEMPCE